MLALLSKLIPFRDYAYAALAASAVVWYNVHIHNLEVAHDAKQNAAIAAETRKVTDAANAKMAQTVADYEAANEQEEANYAITVKADIDQHNLDVQRLRDATAAKGDSSAVLGSAPSSAPAASGGDQSLTGLGSVPANLALEQADAVRQDDAALAKCYADRDSLTGK